MTHIPFSLHSGHDPSPHNIFHLIIIFDRLETTHRSKWIANAEENAPSPARATVQSSGTLASDALPAAATCTSAPVSYRRQAAQEAPAVAEETCGRLVGGQASPSELPATLPQCPKRHQHKNSPFKGYEKQSILQLEELPGKQGESLNSLCFFSCLPSGTHAPRSMR